ncbi:hypothetical protein ED21_24546 [Erythrobacter sp. SD-21]|nr:hypothetical protein ED21_24546 [Erythrobacter sp. SD-21]
MTTMSDVTMIWMPGTETIRSDPLVQRPYRSQGSEAKLSRKTVPGHLLRQQEGSDEYYRPQPDPYHIRFVSNRE